MPAVGPIKARDRGFGGGELLVGLASAQLAGQDFLVGLDRIRADAAGQALVPAKRAAGLTSGLVRIDMDTTDVEVYGRKKWGVAYNHQGQRVVRPHVAVWAQAQTTLAADLGSGLNDPRATAAGLLNRALAGLPRRVRRQHVALRADAGYSPRSWPAAPMTRTSPSRSASNASPRCGGCWPESPKPTGAQPST